ncbi:hypothetical protein HN51_032472 [Arachis hypogaea]
MLPVVFAASVCCFILKQRFFKYGLEIPRTLNKRIVSVSPKMLFMNTLYLGANSQACSLTDFRMSVTFDKSLTIRFEVFADATRDESLIFELLEYKHDVTDNGSAVWFLQDLANEQDAEGSVVIEQSGVLEAPGLMYNNTLAIVTSAVGQMGKLSKPSVGKRKNGYLENGDSIHPYSQMEQYPHLKQPLEHHPVQFRPAGRSSVGGVSIGFLQEIDSSNAQESPSISSALDEISLEATCFRQLQQDMDQLDIRTKLCIRDSLYRLAKNDEQRHTDANVNGQLGDDIETRKALMTQGANRCIGFLDVETNTNPIDRSIAHLLFHKPSDASIFPCNDTTPFKSDSIIHGSVINPPVMTENQVCQKGSSGGVEKNPLAITPSEK